MATEQETHEELRSLYDHTLQCMMEYSQKTNEDRSVPDIADGLKPVHRRLLWAARSTLGISDRSKQLKSARVVGECLGRFHPHGDSAAYGGLVTAATNPAPMFEGVGNFGSLTSNAAAMRYTEVKFTDLGRSLLDPDYLAVSDMTPNYDRSENEPITLPSKLPLFLMQGSSGIGVGLTTQMPSFHLSWLIKVMLAIIDKEDLNLTAMAKAAKMVNSWGGQLLKSKENTEALVRLLETGRSSVKWIAELKENREKKQFLIDEFPPELNLDTLLKKIRDIQQVSDVSSGKGLSYVIQIGKSVNFNEFDQVKLQIQKMLVTSVSYNLNVTSRGKPDADGEFEVKFHQAGVIALLKQWMNHRVRLEIKVLDYRIANKERDIAFTELLIHACDHLDVIFAALKTADPAAAIAKGLKITVPEANSILDLKVRNLSKLDKQGQIEKLKALNTQLKSLQKQRANPVSNVRAYFESVEVQVAKSAVRKELIQTAIKVT